MNMAVTLLYSYNMHGFLDTLCTSNDIRNIGCCHDDNFRTFFRRQQWLIPTVGKKILKGRPLCTLVRSEYIILAKCIISEDRIIVIKLGSML